MKENHFYQLRLLIAIYVAIVIGVAVSEENLWLAVGGILTGLLSMWVAKKKLATKTTDERIEHITGRAATLTYSIMSTTLGLVSLFLIFIPKNQPYLQSVGFILSYITLTMIGLFALLYRHYLNQES